VAAVAALAGTGGTYSPKVTNAWFPLTPGTELVYTGTKDSKATRDVVRVTRQTITIAGARCVVVRDLLYEGGKLEERTSDYYTQDRVGNVWYFGEDTAELDRRGHVTSREGTWRAGSRGARPGIFMFADPRVGRSARQEYLDGHAEDHFRVLNLRAKVKVPYTSSKRALLTEEWTPLEPGVVDHKYYVRGIGTVLEQTVRGGSERNELVSVRGG